MKEYEKLLQQEENRNNNLKAMNLIKLGLFEQKEESTFDFSNKELITVGKKFKGTYDLYENQATGELYYVYPLVENNIGDIDNEKIDMAPYAFDVIYLEDLSQDDYEKCLKASIQEKSGFIKGFYISQFVLMVLTLIAYVLYVIYSLVANAKNGKSAGESILATLGYESILYYAFMAIECGLFVITSITYKKFKAGK